MEYSRIMIEVLKRSRGNSILYARQSYIYDMI